MTSQGLCYAADGAIVVSEAALNEGVVLSANHPLVASIVTAGGGVGCFSYKSFKRWWRNKPFSTAFQPQGLHLGAFGEPAYRSAEGDPYGVVPKELSMSLRALKKADLSEGTIKFSFVRLQKPQDLLTQQQEGCPSDESIVAGSPLPVLFVAPPKFMFEVCVPDARGDGLVSVGVGFRAGWHMITARHLFHSKDKLAYGLRTVYLRYGDRTAKVELSDPIDLLEDGESQDSIRGTYKDVVAYEFGQMTWTKLGVRSLRTTDLSHRGEGPVELAGRPLGDLLVSRGSFVPDPVLEGLRGILSYTATTTTSYSGSPLLVRDGPSYKVAGVHLGGGKNINYGASMPGLRLLLRKIEFGVQASDPLWKKIAKAGVHEVLFGNPITQEFFQEESREKWRRQSELDQNMKEAIAEAAKAEAESAAQALADKEFYEAAMACPDAHFKQSRAQRNQEATADWEDSHLADNIGGGGPSKYWDDDDHRLQKGYHDADDDWRDNSAGKPGDKPDADLEVLRELMHGSGALKALLPELTLSPSVAAAEAGGLPLPPGLELTLVAEESPSVPQLQSPLQRTEVVWELVQDDEPCASCDPHPSAGAPAADTFALPPLAPSRVEGGFRAKIDVARDAFDADWQAFDLATSEGGHAGKGASNEEDLRATKHRDRVHQLRLLSEDYEGLDFAEESPSLEDIQGKAAVLHNLMLEMRSSGQGVMGFLRRDSTRHGMGKKWHKVCINHLMLTGRLTTTSIGGVEWVQPLSEDDRNPGLVKALLAASGALTEDDEESESASEDDPEIPAGVAEEKSDVDVLSALDSAEDYDDFAPERDNVVCEQQQQPLHSQPQRDQAPPLAALASCRSSEAECQPTGELGQNFDEESRGKRKSRKKRDRRHLMKQQELQAAERKAMPRVPRVLGPSREQEVQNRLREVMNLQMQQQHEQQQQKSSAAPSGSAQKRSRSRAKTAQPPPLEGFVEQSPSKPLDMPRPPSVRDTTKTWLPLQDRTRSYAKNRDHISGILPVKVCSKAEFESIGLQMHRWMQHENFHCLIALKGVGARTLLEMPELDLFKAYIGVGEVGLGSLGDELAPIIRGASNQPIARLVGFCAAARGRRKPLRTIRREFLDALSGLTWKGENLESVVGGFVGPPTGPEAVKQSLRANCARLDPGSWTHFLQADDFNGKFEDFVKAYPETAAFTLGSLKGRIDSYLDSMDSTKSAGWSSRYLPGTKGSWREQPELTKYLVMCRLALRIAEGENLHKIGAEDMVRYGFRDPEDVAVKDEGNGARKRQTGRWRMIWITSIIDSICQDVMHHDQNKADINAYSTGGLAHQAVGLGHDDGGIQKIGRLLEQLSRGTESIHSSDIEAWDFSVPRDAIYFDAERRVCLFKDRAQYFHSTADNPRWVMYPMSKLNAIAADCIYAEAAVNSCHLVVVGEEMWTFHEFGITASGIPSTSAQNSPIRSFTLRLAGSATQSAAGDDGLHTGDVDDSLLARAGQKVKPGSAKSSLPSGPVGFTSHEFSRLPGGKWVATFDNLPKLLAHMDLRREDGQPPSSDMLAGMLFAIRHTPEALTIFREVCARLGWEIPAASPFEWE